MADNNSTDIVDLIIDAKNLAIDEINETVKGLSTLGETARKTEKDLDKIRVTQDTIASYKQAGDSMRQLRDEVDRAELAYEQKRQAVKSNKDATDEEILAVKSAKRELADLRLELRNQETEYRRLTRSLREYGVDTKDLDKSQQALEQQFKETAAESEKLNREYRDSVAATRARIAAEKETRDATAAATAAEQAKQQALAASTLEMEKAAAGAMKAARAESDRIAEQERVTASLVKYEQQLRELNRQVDESTLSRADFIRAEEKLRSELQLTDSQTRVTRAALKAEADERKLTEQAIEDQRLEQQKLVQAQEKAAIAAKEAAAAERAAAIELKRVEQAVKEYEIELEKLNQEKNQGRISTGEYIRREAELRQSLKLTEGQVKTSRAAIQADSVARSDASKNTDLLTQATRRLAQVYTVLLAAQKSAQAVTESVKEYGELEAAITKVEKTTGIARVEVEALADQLMVMAKEITPTATNELLRYAEVAGQLGVKSTADIMNLVVAADALALSTNLAGDTAVELLARILSMTGEGIPAIQNLSSSVVALGNDFAVAEDTIVNMTKEIVSGTREINLSSQAAAAFGATLAELGQPAERSRTAIQRLSGAIKAASAEGGRDLELLSNVTKMTGDQIAESLGEAPEQVLVAFLKGLDGINKSGGQMSKVLNAIGIDGTEALGVLTVLSGRTDRLQEALALANQAFIEGDGHIKEAIKSYANQESAIGRLANKFTGLKKEIGEAFSDDVLRAVDKFGDVIDETGGKVVDLMEYIPKIVEGLGGLLADLDDIMFGISADDGGLGAFGKALDLLQLSFNGITGTMKALRAEATNLVVSILEIYNSLREFAGLEVSTESIDKLKRATEEWRNSALEDINDIDNAWNRLNGTQNIAFQDLRDTAARYSEAVKNLTRDEQLLIESILEGNVAKEEESGIYRRLAAAIARSNEELIIRQRIAAQLADAEAKVVADKKAETQAVEQNTVAQQAQNRSLEEYIERANTVAIAIADIQSKRAAGNLTDTEAAEGIGVLTGILDRYNAEIERQGGAITQNNVAIDQNAAKRQQLFQLYQDGLLSEQDFAKAMQQLTVEVTRSTAANDRGTESTKRLTLAQANIAKEIAESELKLDEYRKQLANTALGEQEKTRITAGLRAEEEKLKNLREQQIQLLQFENKTYGELELLQARYQKQLERINLAFERGQLTVGQYEIKTRQLKAALEQINSIIGENTQEIDNNTVATEKNAKAKDLLAESVKKVTSALSLELSAGQQLNKEYNFSDASVDSLNKRMRELQGLIVQNNRVTNIWWRELAKTSNEVFTQEKAAIKAELALRNMADASHVGSFQAIALQRAARAAASSVDQLAKTSMDPLVEDIERAKRELQELSRTVDGALGDAQDRIDRVLGNEQDIVKRRFQRELDEYLAILDKAKEAKDSLLVNRVNEAIRKLQEAQKLEFEEQFGTRLTGTTTQRRQQATTTGTGVTPATGQGLPGVGTGDTPQVVLQLQIGGNGYNVAMPQTQLDKLMADIKRQQQIGG